MDLHVVETGRFKLDGGAMFGVVPRTLWERTNPPDTQNRIDMAMRCLLIAAQGRLVLVDCGLGQKYDEKFQKIYAVDHSITLEGSLRQLGVHPHDITDLVLTHLHFDHCGGATRLNGEGDPELVFPNARVHLQRNHLEWALEPNAREKASFLPPNIQPLVDYADLNLLDGETELLPGLELVVVDGHTDAQQLPLLTRGGRQLLYAADLFPTYGHLPLPYVMGYDTRPLLTLQERQHWLPRLADQGLTLFYEHDPYHECGQVIRTDKGGYKSGDTFSLADWLAETR